MLLVYQCESFFILNLLYVPLFKSIFIDSWNQILLRIFCRLDDDFCPLPLFRSVRSASEAAKSGIPLEKFRDGFQVETGLIHCKISSQHDFLESFAL